MKEKIVKMKIYLKIMKIILSRFKEILTTNNFLGFGLIVKRVMKKNNCKKEKRQDSLELKLNPV